MAYSRRTPPIKVIVDINTFNLLLELITKTCEKIDEKKLNELINLKNKILKYSIPHVEDNGNTIIDMRFFPNEAEYIINILLNNIENSEVKTNYFDILKKVRDSIK